MDDRHKILVACMPKSGSTYLATVISNLPDFRVTSWVPGYGRREQELCFNRLQTDDALLTDHNLVAQHHVRYSEVTEKYMKEFNLKPVVLIRNIYDVVASLIDHHKSESVVYPMAFVPQDIVNWDENRAAKFVASMVMPWYFNFFVSWHNCSDKVQVSYEDLITDPARVVQIICEEWKINVSEQDVVGAVECADSMHTRKNVGIAGRGNKLPEECRNHIKEMATFYSGIDFSKIGISIS
jgi:hypothetical protein